MCFWYDQFQDDFWGLRKSTTWLLFEEEIEVIPGDFPIHRIDWEPGHDMAGKCIISEPNGCR